MNSDESEAHFYSVTPECRRMHQPAPTSKNTGRNLPVSSAAPRVAGHSSGRARLGGVVLFVLAVMVLSPVAGVLPGLAPVSSPAASVSASAPHGAVGASVSPTGAELQGASAPSLARSAGPAQTVPPSLSPSTPAASAVSSLPGTAPSVPVSGTGPAAPTETPLSPSVASPAPAAPSVLAPAPRVLTTPATVTPSVAEYGTWVANDSVGASPGVPAFDTGNGYAYIPSFYGGTVTVVAENGSVVTTISNLNGADAVAYDPNDGDLYVSTWGGSLYIVSGTTNSVIYTASPGFEPSGVAYDPADNTVYLALYGANHVLAYDPTLVSNTLITVATNPGSMAYDPADQAVYVLLGGSPGSTDEIVGTTVTTTITVGNNPNSIAYDSGNGDMYVANGGSSTVSAISSVNNAVITLNGFSGIPAGLAYDAANGYVYVAQGNLNTLQLVSGTLSPPVASISVVAKPGDMCYDPATGELFVTGGTTSWGSVAVVSTLLSMGDATPVARAQGTAGTLASTIPVGPNVFDAVYDPDNGNIYAPSYGTGRVGVISGATNSLVMSLPVGTNPVAVAYDPANLDIYVSNQGSANISVISGVTNQVVANIGGFSQPDGIAYDADNGEIYVAGQGSNTVYALSGASGLVVQTWSLTSCAPTGVVYDSHKGDVYVACSGTNSVMDIANGANNPSSIGVGSDPRGMGYDPQTGQVFVSNYGLGSGNTVTVISDATDSVYATLTVGTGPDGITYDSGTGDLYLSNFQANTVTVLAGTTLTTLATLSGSSLAYPCWGTYDGRNGEVYLSTVNGVEEISTLTNVVPASSFSFDLGMGASQPVQDLFVEAPVLDQGSGVNQISFTTSPSKGISCQGNLIGNDLVLANCTGTVAGTYSVTLTLIDGLGNSVSTTFSVVAVPAMTIPSVAPSQTSADVGQPIHFSASVTNGSAPYSYAWGYPALMGCSATTSRLLYCTPNAAGIGNSVGVVVTDSNGATSVTGALNGYTIYADPSVSVPIATAYSLDLGQQTVLSTTSIGGSGAVAFSWNGLPTGCPSASIPVVTCVPTATGTFSVTATFLDTNGWNASSAPTKITVLSALAAPGLTASPSTLDSNQSLTLTASDTGGTGTYSYGWSGLPTGCVAGNSAVLTCRPYSPLNAAYTVHAWVNDTNGGSATTTVVIRVDQDPTLTTPTATPVAEDVGTPVSFLTNAISYATGAPTYSWSGLPVGCANANATSVSCTPTVAGTYVLDATILDSNGFNVSSATLTYTVSPSLATPTMSSNRGSLDLGQSIVYQTAPSGGSGSYSYAWTGLPTGCVSANVVSLVCTPTAPGTFTPQVMVTDSNHATATSGSITTAVSVDPSVPYVSVTRSTLDFGQSTSFSAGVAGGSGGNVYFWSGLPAGCPSAKILTDSCTPGTTGTFSVRVWVNDSTGTNESSSSLTLVVSPALGLAGLTASRTALDVGQSSTLVASGTGGTGTYSYGWARLPTGCAGGSSATITCLPGAAGTWTVEVWVNDSNGATSQTQLAVTVSADPTLTTPTATPSTSEVGVGTTLRAVATPGSGTDVYSWSGLPSGCPSSNSLTLSCTPAAAGAYSVIAHVRDSNGMNVSSAPLTLTVYAPLSGASLTAATALDVGQFTTLTASVSGGSGLVSYAWKGLPTGCSAANVASFICSPTGTGTFTVHVWMNDSSGGTATASTGITVSPDPSVATPAATNRTLDLGQRTTLSSTGSVGSGTPSYTWTNLPAGCTSVNALTLPCTPTGAGTSPVTVTVTDSNGVTVTSSALTVVVSPALGTPVLSVSPGGVDVGQTVTFSATASGGDGSYTYGWSGLPTGCAGGNSATVVCVPTASGPFTVTLSVTDGNAATAGTTAAISVSVLPTIATPTLSRSSLDVGQTVNLSATVTAGSGTDTYVWFGLPSGCTGVTTLSVTCSPTTAGSFALYAGVTDSNGGSAVSPVALLLVSAPLATPVASASITSPVIGSALTLSVTVAGGSGPYQYQWTSLPGCPGGTGPTEVCAPSATGTYPVHVTVTDANQVSAVSASLTLQVLPRPSVGTPTADRTTLDVSQTVNLSVTVSGAGTGATINWSGLPAGCLSANATALACTPTAPGIFSVTVTATTLGGVSMTSGPLLLDVSPAIGGASLTASDHAIDAGRLVSLSASFTGGSGGEIYAWTGLPSGCASSGTPSLLCTPSTGLTATTTYTITVSISDSNLGSATASATLTVAPRLAVGLSSTAQGSKNVAPTSFSVDASASGGLGALTYQWYLNGSAVGGNVSSLSESDLPAGTYVFTVTVTDPSGARASSEPLAVTVTAPVATSSSSTSGGTNALDWVLLGLVAGVLALLVLLLVLIARGRKQGEPASSAAPGPKSPEPTPPAGPSPTAPDAPPTPSAEWKEEE